MSPMSHALTLFLSEETGASVPALIVSLGATRNQPLVGHFIDLMVQIGWQPAEAPVSIPAAFDETPVAELTFGADGMRLRTDTTINSGTIAEDRGGFPRPPEGWWEALEREQGQCVVVLVDKLDLRGEDLLTQLDVAARRDGVLTGRATVIRQGS